MSVILLAARPASSQPLPISSSFSPSPENPSLLPPSRRRFPSVCSPRKRARRKFHRKHRTPPPQHHRRPVVSDHLSPNQGHHEILLITLKLLDTCAQQIEFEIDDKDHFSISAAGRNLMFPAASDLVRHRRGVHQLSGLHTRSSLPASFPFIDLVVSALVAPSQSSFIQLTVLPPAPVQNRRLLSAAHVRLQPNVAPGHGLVDKCSSIIFL
ncbi:uncharacterized protein [Lolium perenne]|uniref:uncharacterized protein isoform X2 n=1 Tax=Lolium perenne TaxID=4522 RepID=UPI003A9A1385